ncbi:MAG: translation initiation factor IF-2 [Candidatus Diapherotrites archaeon CG11_big_fil_rev_8_21_14_0_20_37_9]|nr:MAG: translation initiation factor IF-2 [Candidatus Diapherotrites archaeon CG11_big_fil_rev_8_21_14_0_20_37_9]
MVIRKPIITVLGHVDAGKTKILDAVRGTSIAEKEAGGITQHIGATEVPLSIIKKQSGTLLQKYKFDLKIPGLLFIDTPGHEAFTNLRKRGGSIADLAVLVVDVHKGLQDQTKEAIEILKSYKCPFIVAINKIDTIQGWRTVPGQSASESMAAQKQEVLERLDIKIYELIGQLHQKGFPSERFDRIKDFTKEIPIIPTAAKAKIGVAELMMFLAGLSQRYLDKKLEIHTEGQCRGTVLEVREEKGLGKTIDVIIYDGMLKVGEEIAVGGKNSVITTKIRALLEPKPLDDMKNPSEKFRSVKEVYAAAGVKIAAPGLEDAISGCPVRHATEKNVKEISEELQKIKITSDSIGPIVRSNTLGSLEAMVKLLEDRGIKVMKADVGEIARKDVLEIMPVADKDKYKGVIFAFHTKVSEAAEIEAKKNDVMIFKNDVVYRILEEYEEWAKQEREKEKQEKLSSIVFPAKITILPGHIFRNSGPAVVGVRVEEGKLKKGVKLMKKGTVIGRIQGIQSNGETVTEAKKGDEVAVSIDDAVCGKHIFEKDNLYSYIPQRDFLSIENLAENFSAEEIELIQFIKKMEEKVEA